MKSLPTVLIQEKNRLYTPHPWLVLIDVLLDATHSYYFAGNNEDVQFQGRTYIAFPFALDPAVESINGEIPTVGLKIANVTQVVHAVIEGLDGAVGARVIIRVVHTDNLAQDFSDLEMEFMIVATQADAEWLTFSLGAANPLRRKYPQYRYLANHCGFKFKGKCCGYSGSATICDRTFERCEQLGNSDRFGGFKGLSGKGWRAG